MAVAIRMKQEGRLDAWELHEDEMDGLDYDPCDLRFGQPEEVMSSLADEVNSMLPQGLLIARVHPSYFRFNIFPRPFFATQQDAINCILNNPSEYDEFITLKTKKRRRKKTPTVFRYGDDWDECQNFISEQSDQFVGSRLPGVKIGISLQSVTCDYEDSHAKLLMKTFPLIYKNKNITKYVNQHCWDFRNNGSIEILLQEPWVIIDSCLYRATPAQYLKIKNRILKNISIGKEEITTSKTHRLDSLLFNLVEVAKDVLDRQLYNLPNIKYFTLKLKYKNRRGKREDRYLATLDEMTALCKSLKIQLKPDDHILSFIARYRGSWPQLTKNKRFQTEEKFAEARKICRRFKIACTKYLKAQEERTKK